MTKVLYLVNPPNPNNMKGFPGSLLALDLWAREVCGVESHILNEESTDYQILHLSLEEKLKDAPEDAIFGITATTATYQDALHTALVLRGFRQKSIIILGGHHFDGQQKIVLDSHEYIDIIVAGEGEKALQAIIDGILDFPGITYRDENGEIKQHIAAKGIKLSRDDIGRMDIRRYNPFFKSTQFEETNLVTARGCPMECSFCAVAEDKVVAQDPDQVVEQIDYLVRQNQESGQPTIIAIQDNFFAQTVGRAREIGRKLKEYRKATGNEFEWNMQTRVEQFCKEDLVQILAEAGCTAAYFGVENFDPSMLAYLNKSKDVSVYVKQTMKAIENCAKYEINPHIDFQVGIPGEDETVREHNHEVFLEIGRKFLHIKPMVYPSLSVVYPGTGLHRRLLSLGVPETIYETFTRFEREDRTYREALQGYFAHGNGGIPSGILDSGELISGRIEVNKAKLETVISYVERLRKIQGIIVHDFKESKREVAL